MFYGVTAEQCRNMAFELADKCNIKHQFNTTKRTAGKAWLEGFLKRNPSVTTRKPEALSINRIRGFNKSEVRNFYSNLQQLVDTYHFPAARIFNMDETGLSTVQVT